MRSRNLFYLFTFIAVFWISTTSISAQNNDSSQSVLPKPDVSPEAQPKNVQEMLVKMRIEEEKKHFDEMLDRGREAAKISDELERSFSEKKEMTKIDLEKLENLEK